MRRPLGFILILILLILAALAGCAPSAATSEIQPTFAATQPSAAEAPTNSQSEMEGEPSFEPQPTAGPELQIPETRQVELEYPSELRLGDSDVIRMTLAPSAAGYTLQAEFPEHQTVSEEIMVDRPQGYEVFAVARLDGVAFDISPTGEQSYQLTPGDTVTWNWSLTANKPGRQRLGLTLLLRWVPAGAGTASTREAVLFSSGMEVKVTSILGLPHSQAAGIGAAVLLSLALVGGLIFFRLPKNRTQVARENHQVVIESAPGFQLTGEPMALLKALFPRYARLLVTHEFLSGYSGARTFLAQPIRSDGRTDAYTIVKMGKRLDIEREYANYETFVKDTLPPITARIQQVPIRLRNGSQAALRYTFIGEAGRAPVSLRKSLLNNPDSGFIRQLYDIFAPYWWQQRSPYTFSLAAEYDRLLPAHYVIAPENGRDQVLDGSFSPAAVHLKAGDLVQLRHFSIVEMRADGKSYALAGSPQNGQPGLRVRWLGPCKAQGVAGRVVATRADLLAERVRGMDRCGLADPITRLPELLARTVHGTRSIIHGDLNLENILVGPGELLWLIDFAQTREGHTLLDFAHLKAEVIGRVLPGCGITPDQFLSQFSCNEIVLLNEIDRVAKQCLFAQDTPEEFNLAVAISCLGALKYANLEPEGRHLLYLSAAYLVSTL